MSTYRAVFAAGQRMNVHGSTDRDDAIRLAREHWADEVALGTAALEAVERGEVEVTEEKQ